LLHAALNFAFSLSIFRLSGKALKILMPIYNVRFLEKDTLAFGV